MVNVPATFVVNPQTAARSRLPYVLCDSAKTAPPVRPSGLAHTWMILFVTFDTRRFAGSYSVSGTAIGSNELNSSTPLSHTSVEGWPGKQISHGKPAVISTTDKPNSFTSGGSLINVTTTSSSSSSMPKHRPFVEHCPVGR